MRCLRDLPRVWKMVILIVLSLPTNLLRFSNIWLHNALSELWPTVPAGEVAYLVFIATNLLAGISLLIVLLAVEWIEKPISIRKFFKLGPLDWPGLGLIAVLTFALNTLERLFLRRLVFEPVRLFLLSRGLWGGPSLEVGFQPPHHYIPLNLVLLILVLWVEAPEEIFFRGYVQNHLQEIKGPNIAVFLGAAIWSGWHIFAPAEFLRIFVYGLSLGFVFRLRQNSTPLAIWHPVSNRLLMFAYLVRASA